NEQQDTIEQSKGVEGFARLEESLKIRLKKEEDETVNKKSRTFSRDKNDYEEGKVYVKMPTRSRSYQRPFKRSTPKSILKQPYSPKKVSFSSFENNYFSERENASGGSSSFSASLQKECETHMIEIFADDKQDKGAKEERKKREEEHQKKWTLKEKPIQNDRDNFLPKGQSQSKETREKRKFARFKNNLTPASEKTGAGVGKLRSFVNVLRIFQRSETAQICPSLKKRFDFYPAHYGGSAVETFQEVVELELTKLADETTKKKYISNLSKTELEALQTLKKDVTTVIKSADKGGLVVVLNTADYVREAERQLSDTASYQILKGDPTVQFRRELVNILEKGHDSAVFGMREHINQIGAESSAITVSRHFSRCNQGNESCLQIQGIDKGLNVRWDVSCHI
ncbi:hypothetical protein XELAEV_18009300mg, partial [Xenopus laevis]